MTANTVAVSYNDKVVRQFAIMTVVWGVVGMLVGVIIAAQLMFPELNFDTPWLTFSRLRPLHTNAVIFAFGGSAIFATSYYTVVATLGYTLRLEKRRELRFDLRVNNVLNDQGPLYSVSTALRPKGGDLTSPARETVANIYAYKQPVSVNLTTTLRF